MRAKIHNGGGTRGVTAIPEIRPKKKPSNERYHIFIEFNHEHEAWYWFMQKGRRLVAKSGLYSSIGNVNRSAALMQDSIREEVRGPIHYPTHRYSGD